MAQSINVNWYINRAVETTPIIATPAVVGTAIVGLSVVGDGQDYIYTGEEISPTWLYGYDTSIITMSGDTSGVDVGEYTVIFELNDPTNYEWEDGTTDPKTVTWEIKAA